jgi:hypothetical protein
MIENKKILLERFKEAIFNNDITSASTVASELRQLISEDKLSDIRILTDGFVSLCLLYSKGYIKEPSLEGIEEAILERLKDKPKLDVVK